jgi:DNA-binding NtrC family response regulator
MASRPDYPGRLAIFFELPYSMKYTADAANVLIKLPDDGIDLDEVEREILCRALEKHGGNQPSAAQYLNITRSALIYQTQKYVLQHVEPAGDEKDQPKNS